MKESPVNLHISVPGLDNFSFDSHGEIDDLVIATKESSEALKMLIALLPKKARELEEISSHSPASEIKFFNMVRQSFRYLQTIIDLKDIEEEKGLDSKEYEISYGLRDKSLDLTIKAINAWNTSLSKNNINNKFMKSIVTSPQVNTLYGMFAVGFVSDIYTDKNFNIEKYSK